MDPVKAISLAALCLILLGGVLYLTTGEVYSSLFVFPAMAAAAAYTLAPQLRWWHWQRHAPDLPTELAPLLDRFARYRRLDLAGKREFRRRTFLLREATHFRGMAPIEEKVPIDVQYMVAASAATLTFPRPEFQLKDIETVVFYLHHFPTPRHEQLHVAEFYGPDGAIIYTLNVFLRSVVEPDKYPQLGYYAYAQALLYVDAWLNDELAPHLLGYADIEEITDFSEPALREYLGLEPDLAALTLTVYHSHHECLRALRPAVFTALEALFGNTAPASSPPK